MIVNIKKDGAFIMISIPDTASIELDNGIITISNIIEEELSKIKRTLEGIKVPSSRGTKAISFRYYEPELTINN